MIKVNKETNKHDKYIVKYVQACIKEKNRLITYNFSISPFDKVEKRCFEPQAVPLCFQELANNFFIYFANNTTVTKRILHYLHNNLH